MIFDLYYLKSLSCALDSDQFKKALAENIEEELTAVVARIIEDCCTDATNQTKGFQKKDIPALTAWFSRFFVWTTNASEGAASKANYNGARMCTPPRSLKILIESHQNEMTKLLSNYRKSYSSDQCLTTIGMNCMTTLFGQTCPDPTGYTFLPAKTDNDGLNTLNTLTCTFTTDEGDGGDDENWSTLITYPNKNGSIYQVYCEKHAAYTASMLCPCSCSVKMFDISKEIKIARTRERRYPNMTDFPDFAPNHMLFEGLFLHSIYHKSLKVDKGQIKLAESVVIKPCSTALSKNQCRVNKYARSKDGTTLLNPAQVCVPPIHRKSFQIEKRKLSRGENGPWGPKMKTRIPKNKNRFGSRGTNGHEAQLVSNSKKVFWLFRVH